MLLNYTVTSSAYVKYDANWTLVEELPDGLKFYIDLGSVELVHSKNDDLIFKAIVKTKLNDEIITALKEKMHTLRKKSFNILGFNIPDNLDSQVVLIYFERKNDIKLYSEKESTFFTDNGRVVFSNDTRSEYKPLDSINEKFYNVAYENLQPIKDIKSISKELDSNQSAELYKKRGDIYFNVLNNPKLALEDYKKAVDIEPNIDFYIQIGDIEKKEVTMMKLLNIIQKQ